MKRLLVSASALALLAITSSAGATGMQGHMYCSELALEHVTSPELSAILGPRRVHWLNGSFLPDSGYAANDPYGEMAHWEQFVEGYIRYIRDNFQAPYTEGEAADHVAVLLGAASHGIVDQTFDILFMDKAREEDGSTDTLDTAIDALVVNDANRTENPDVVVDTAALSSIFEQAFGHMVTPDTIAGGMDRAKMGLGATIGVLAYDPEPYRKDYPWASSHYLVPTVPGGYPYNAEVVARYWENIWRRLNADYDLSDYIIGTNPQPGGQFVGVDHTSVDSYITVFTGHGMERDSITADSAYIETASGERVPTEIRVRGDEWINTLQLKPLADWDYQTEYRLVLTTDLETQNGAFPSQDYVLSFRTECAPGDSSDGCVPPDLPDPISGEAGAAGAAGAAGSSGLAGAPGTGGSNASATGGDDDGGCTLGGGGARGTLMLLGLAALGLGLRRRRSG